MTKISLTPDEHTMLWNDFRNGDRDAFSRIYEIFTADLYRYGFNLVRNKQLVEDCLHELFLHLHNHKKSLGPTDNIRFYLYRALRRRLLDALKKVKKYESDEHAFDHAQFIVESFESQYIEEQARIRQQQLVLEELNKLPKRQKEILYLVYMKGLSYQEAAEVMDISMKSVYNTVNVALTSLRKYIRKSLLREEALWLYISFIIHMVFPNT
ncbi:RNA polymerase sigma factor [Dyadobacter aurulentus]|uniref:RNA polymerase sigma factor n=1 Tax=Dyadobacter sp. UC 10 TaxID=2605428 RepID=UPI0011F178D2|nr:sigma-70 family RNA polymerase sigma factor [Dyadobacter sp. UC 10]KAA0992117.1 sigma-70 family RNA polymerase sigma factor [Dyadobacter sp. UC 10]